MIATCSNSRPLLDDPGGYLEGVIRRLKEHGERVTARREQVARSLASATSPLSLSGLIPDGANEARTSTFGALGMLINLGLAVRSVDGWIPAIGDPPSMVLTHDLTTDTYRLEALPPEARALITQDSTATVLIEVTTGEKPPKPNTD